MYLATAETPRDLIEVKIGFTVNGKAFNRAVAAGDATAVHFS